MRRRRSMIAVVLAVAVAIVVAQSPWSRDGDGRRGSTDLGTGTPVEIDATPRRYRITYRVEDGDRVSTERVTVERPFDSRVEQFAGETTTGDPETIDVSTFGKYERVSNDSGRLAIAVPPGVAPADLRLAAVLPDALENGLLERRERRRVAGRDCQVYRTGQSLRLGVLEPPTAERFVDACVDAAGLLLEEVDGDRRRLAVHVEVGAAVEASAMVVGERTVPVLSGGGAIQELTPESRTPGTFWELGDDLALPAVGRYAVVPPQPDTYSDPSLRSRRTASTTDVLSDGRDVVLVDRGGSLGGEDLLGDAAPGRPVDLGAIGEGVVVLTAYGAELTVKIGGGQFVRVSGTVPVDDLVAVARGLHEVDGGELTPLGDAW